MGFADTEIITYASMCSQLNYNTIIASYIFCTVPYGTTAATATSSNVGAESNTCHESVLLTSLLAIYVVS